MKTREQLQEEALNEVKQYKRLILSWSTGVGKSLVGIQLFNYLFGKNSDDKFLIVVAERAHKQNWKEEFEKHLGKNQAKAVLKNVTIECYASLKKVCDIPWKAIVFDEAHHLNSEIRLEFLSVMKAEYVICMSATMSGRKFGLLRATLNMTFGNFLISKIRIQDAIDNEILPEPEIIAIPMRLSDRPNTCTYIKEWGSKNFRREIHCYYRDRFTYAANRRAYPHCKLVIHCSEQEKYNELNADFEYWKKQSLRNPGNVALKNKWLQIGSQRKRFLGELKTSAAYNLIKNLGNKRFICFCTSVAQAEALGGTQCIHSKKLNNQKIINDFNDEKTSSIYAVGMGQEGLNLRDIEVGIIVQLDGEERGWIQKSGRIYRAKHPVIYVFYVKNTRDEEFYKNAIYGINPKYIKERII